MFWLVLTTNDCFPTCTTLSKRAVLPCGRGENPACSTSPDKVAYTWIVDASTKLCAKQQPYVFVLLIGSAFSLSDCHPILQLLIFQYIQRTINISVDTCSCFTLIQTTRDSFATKAIVRSIILRPNWNRIFV